MFQIITVHKSKYFPTIFHNGDFVTKVTHYLLFNVNNQDHHLRVCRLPFFLLNGRASGLLSTNINILKWADFSYKKKKKNGRATFYQKNK